MTSPADRCDGVERELEALYLGQLSASEAETVRAHVDGCERCAASLEEVRRVFRLAESLETIEPSPRFRARMQELVESEAGPRSRPDRGAVAAVLGLLVYAGGRIRTSRRLRVGLVVSGVAHAVLLLVLTFLVLPASERRRRKLPFIRPQATYVERMKENLASPDEGEISTPDDPPELAREIEPDDFDGHLLPSDRARPEFYVDRRLDTRDARWRTPVGRRWPTDAVAALVMGRIDEDVKAARLREAHGEAPVHEAIRRSLRWLAESQEDDGHWAAGEGPTYAGYEDGVTALALLAFLGDGHSMHRGSHRDVVRTGFDWLRARQEPGGLIGDPEFDRPMYGHALATLALLELYVLDYEFLPWERERLRRQITRAVRLIERAQKADGGWRYLPRRGEDDHSSGDASVTVWQLLALELAKDAGYRVDDSTMARAGRFLVERTREGDGAVGYREPPSADADLDATLTAGALAIRMLDVAPETTARRRALLRRSLPEDDDPLNPLLWFYATYAQRRTGDARPDGWTAYTRRMLLESQRRDGSWPAEVEYGQQGGPVYTTAIGALILEAAYRVAPGT